MQTEKRVSSSVNDVFAGARGRVLAILAAIVFVSFTWQAWIGHPKVLLDFDSLILSRGKGHSEPTNEFVWWISFVVTVAGILSWMLIVGCMALFASSPLGSAKPKSCVRLFVLLVLAGWLQLILGEFLAPR